MIIILILVVYLNGFDSHCHFFAIDSLCISHLKFSLYQFIQDGIMIVICLEYCILKRFCLLPLFSNDWLGIFLWDNSLFLRRICSPSVIVSAHSFGTSICFLTSATWYFYSKGKIIFSIFENQISHQHMSLCLSLCVRNVSFQSVYFNLTLFLLTFLKLYLWIFSPFHLCKSFL